MHRSRLIALIKAAGWLAPVVVTLVLYFQVHDHQYIDFDDMYYTYENPMVAQGLSIHGIRWAFTESYFANYHPLTWVSHMADFEFWGNSPGAFALGNATLHAANSLLVALLLARLFRSKGIGIAAGVVFAAHPQLVEAVAWISQRKTLLSTFFALGSMNLYLGSLREDRAAIHAPRYIVAVVLYVLSLLSKGMYVTLPAMLILLELIHASRARVGINETHSGASAPFDRARWGSLARRISPFAILALVFAVVTVKTQSGYGAVQSVDALPLTTRFATALTGVASYVRQFIVPTGFSIYYPRPNSFTPASLVFSAFVIATVTYASIRSRKVAGYFPLLGWLLFLVALAPVVGLIQVGDQARADRYMYGPILGLLVMTFATIEATRAMIRNRRLRLACASVLAAWIFVACATTYRQVSNWYSSYTIGMTSEAQVGPIPQLVGLRATTFMRARKYKAAIPLYRQVLAETPDHLLSLNNLALAELRVGNTEVAIALCKRHIALAPEIGTAYANLALAYVRTGRNEDARRTLDTAEDKKMITLSARRTLDRVRAMLGGETPAQEQLDDLP